jgi:hypothetical protein
MRGRPGLENRPTQTERLVTLLRDRSPSWVPLAEILNLRISQYGARVYQARHEWGLNIESRVEIVEGKKHSFFRLIARPQAAGRPESNESAMPATAMSFPEFGRLAPESYGVD